MLYCNIEVYIISISLNNITESKNNQSSIVFYMYSTCMQFMHSLILLNSPHSGRAHYWMCCAILYHLHLLESSSHLIPP